MSDEQENRRHTVLASVRVCAPSSGLADVSAMCVCVCVRERKAACRVAERHNADYINAQHAHNVYT